MTSGLRVGPAMPGGGPACCGDTGVFIAMSKSPDDTAMVGKEARQMNEGTQMDRTRKMPVPGALVLKYLQIQRSATM